MVSGCILQVIKTPVLDYRACTDAVRMFFNLSSILPVAVKPTFVMVLLSLGVLLLSWLAAWGAAILTAVALQLTGHSLSWFSTPTLILLIYVTPSFLAMATVHELWRHRVGYQCVCAV